MLFTLALVDREQ